MDDKTLDALKQILQKDLEEQLNNAIFGSTTTATQAEPLPPLTYESIVDAINKIPPKSESLLAKDHLDFDEIRLSNNGWEKMKEELSIVEEKADKLGDMYLMGCQVLIRDYMPDNIAIAVKRPEKYGEEAKIVAIIDLGFNIQPFKFTLSS